PILFAVSPLAAIRSAPVITQSTSPAAMSDAAAESAITACGIAAVSSSHAVRRAPWRSGRVSSTQTCASRPRSHAVSSAPTAQRAVCLLEIVAARGRERDGVGGCDADRGRAADDHRPDGLRDLARGRATNVLDAPRQLPLVEEDHRVVLEPEDLLRLEHATLTGRSGALVPRGEVLHLLLGQLIDGDAHRRQLEARDLLVDL